MPKKKKDKEMAKRGRIGGQKILTERGKDYFSKLAEKRWKKQRALEKQK